MDLGTGRVKGHPHCGFCYSCGCGLGALDAAIGDQLCALCRIDIPKLTCIECRKGAKSARERWVMYRGHLYCPLCAETAE